MTGTGRQPHVTSGVGQPCQVAITLHPSQAGLYTAFRVHPLTVWSFALAALPPEMPLLLILAAPTLTVLQVSVQAQRL